MVGTGEALSSAQICSFGTGVGVVGAGLQVRVVVFDSPDLEISLAEMWLAEHSPVGRPKRLTQLPAIGAWPLAP